MKITFWGVRGSVPTPGPTTVKYGGNTPCVELHIDESLYILDAGTGIRTLGLDLLRRPKNGGVHLFITHHHWDHIQGLPFFVPAFRGDYELNIYGYESPEYNLKPVLSKQMDPEYFPVQLGDLEAKLHFHGIQEGSFRIKNVRIDAMFMNHPGYTLGYRFNLQGKSIVYATDNQPYADRPPLGNWAVPAYFQSTETSNFDNMDFNVEEPDARIVEFSRNADVLIHDAQYTQQEFAEKNGWGHSPYDYAVKVAEAAGVKKLVLFHHDPEHSDVMINQIEHEAKSLLHSNGPNIECVAAYEGLVVSV